LQRIVRGGFLAPSDETHGNKIDAVVWGSRFDTVQIKSGIALTFFFLDRARPNQAGFERSE
jgi:hypothetical protein